MRLVDAPRIRPHKCALTPFIGATHPEARWIDTGNDYDRDRVYVCDLSVLEAGRLFGFPTPKEHAAVVAERDRLARDLEDVRRQLEAADRELNAVAVLKNSRQWKQERKPGRPAKSRVQEVA